MNKLNKKIYKKPCLALTVFNSASVVSASGGLVSGDKFKQISKGGKENINIDNLK